MCRIKVTKLGMRNEIDVKLDVYYFEDGGYTVAYNPSLDISAYGDNKDEAKSEFTELLRIYFEECINEGTLCEDLRNHGWTTGENGMLSPDFEEQLSRNSVLKQVVSSSRDYTKKTYPVTMCV